MKEAGILILGTICDEDGCLTLYEPQMSVIVPFLLEELKGTSSSALIKSTTLWTLQKFSRWTACETDTASFAQYIEAILLQTQSADLNIQESACTSLSATFQTMAGLE